MSRDRKKTQLQVEDKFDRKRRKLAARTEREEEEISRAKLHELERRACETILDSYSIIDDLEEDT